jgi:transposase
VLTEGCCWRAIDRPEARWNSVDQYHRRWSRSGLWAELLKQVRAPAAGTLRFLDSSHVKVHAHGANPAGGQEAQAMGRTKGGLNTKIHALVDNCGRPVSVVLSAGQAADIAVAPVLLTGIAAGCCVIADKAYDSNAFRALLARTGHRACIPSLSRRLVEIPYAKATYKKRHRVENFFQKLKRYRRIATRYDKLAQTYFGFLLLAIFVVELLG